MTLMEEVGECIMYWIGVWRLKRKKWRANGQILVPSPPPSMNSWTWHMHYYYRMFLTDCNGLL